MKKKIRYTKGEMDIVKVIDDFLPSPQNLLLKDNPIKVIIYSARNSVDFFNLEVSKSPRSPQETIKRLLDNCWIDTPEETKTTSGAI